jgi:hypothetical protein
MLVLLGFDISEPTVSRYLQQLKGTPEESKTLAFLNNHRGAIAAFDFSTVDNLYFGTSTASSLSNMPGGAFCTLMSDYIQQATGSQNNCMKRSRCRVLTDTCSLPLVGNSLKFARSDSSMTHLCCGIQRRVTWSTNKLTEAVLVPQS